MRDSHHISEVVGSSDIAVVLGISSAGILCALRGARTVFWDPSGARKGPLSQWIHRFGWDNEKIVFERMDELIPAVEEYLRSASASSELGDFTSRLDEIDSFRDGKTGLRVGRFVRWFLEGIDQGFNRDQALKFASDNYTREWGAEKIHLTPGNIFED